MPATDAVSTLTRTLAAHGLSARVDAPILGPSTLTYPLTLSPGTRVDELDRLTRTLALALGVEDVRVTRAAGILALEVPRADRQAVTLSDVPIPDASPPLVWPVGLDTLGTPVFGNLARAPHVLIAGTTGAGKSTAVHALLSTLTARNGPGSLRLALVDVKRVELAAYRDAPHLAGPIATDVEQATDLLAWALEELERRYTTLEAVGARSVDDLGATVPRLVVVIDELADLMLTGRKTTEPLIVRLAQLGRAAGVHLVLATQRPSADILSGLIRANVPTRLTLTVQSHTDSGIALGLSGAETLAGAGDALWLPAGVRRPVRVQVPHAVGPTTLPERADPAPMPAEVAAIVDGPPERLCLLCHRWPALSAGVCLDPECVAETEAAWARADAAFHAGSDPVIAALELRPSRWRMLWRAVTGR
ncbi:DNA translocase FtsK [Beutenbergia cavernae]|uniref:DNA translocase FtsK n=1 Tax=Beutenbergia cavernae TaxID=84757 RepID=UPI00019AD162|nr:DNA translocase FtsK [Beutenbergia cavernae]